MDGGRNQSTWVGSASRIFLIGKKPSCRAHREDKAEHGTDTFGVHRDGKSVCIFASWYRRIERPKPGRNPSTARISVDPTTLR